MKQRMTRRVKLEMTQCEFVDEIAEDMDVTQSIIIQAILDYFITNDISSNELTEYVNNYKSKFPDTYPSNK
tara:strand:+ start:24605 stop:24817 length:213 start_codon:yes stop_codon:yes gene_type:complete